MGQHFLDAMFHPGAIAVFGASDAPDRAGMRVFRNLIGNRYAGTAYPVNPKHTKVQDRKSYARLADIEAQVDLAVIATPAPSVNAILRQCGEHGVRVAVIVSAGFRESGEAGARLERELVETAAHYGVRLIGPNCPGFMRPVTGLDASSLDTPARAGRLALISQSGALCTAILDWATPHGIGFSAVVPLGNMVDVGFGDFLDYLALDSKTDAILLYVEGVRHARRFMSGVRAASRMKPVIVLKAGRLEAGSRAAATHSGALIGSDEVFGAALERAGVVRAYNIGQLFAAAEILQRGSRVRGARLAMVTNGGGPGALATDRAEELGITVAQLGDATLEALEEIQPKHRSHGNPVSIPGDAPPEHYGAAVYACLGDRAVDGVLALLAPQARSEPTAAASAVIDAAHSHRGKPVLACWMGETAVAEARRLFSEEGLPDFATPELAVEAFGYLTRFNRNQKLLLETPGPLSDHRAPDVEAARLVVEGALGEGRSLLSSAEARAIISAFHIPTLPLREARSAREALVAAEILGFPVALKIDSPDISHKSDVGGVVLNLGSARELRQAYRRLMEEIARERPEARIRGVTVQPMVSSPHGRDLLLGVTRDPVFGPAITFGAGGTAVEILKDSAVALPPLNAVLAERLIDRTRVARLLEGFRRMPAADRQAVVRMLLRVSEMVCELPQVRELDINPLVVDEQGARAVDVRVIVERPPPRAEPYAHMAIHPYPSALEHRTQLADGTDLIIRPMRPEDAEMEREFVRELSPQSKYMRFMQSIKELTPEMLVRFTQPDYDREMALIALVTLDGRRREVGVARYAINPDGKSCEFALAVSDELHKRGIGSRLMERLMEAARERGLARMEGEVLAENRPMLNLCRELDFTIRTAPDDPGVRLVDRRL